MFSGNIHPGKVHLLIVFRNPAWLVGLPDFYPTLLCGPYLQGVHTNAGQLCCQSPVR